MKLFEEVSNRNDSVSRQLPYRKRSDNSRNDRIISNALRASGKSVPIGTKPRAKKIAEDHYRLFRHVTTISRFQRRFTIKIERHRQNRDGKSASRKLAMGIVNNSMIAPMIMTTG